LKGTHPKCQPVSETLHAVASNQNSQNIDTSISIDKLSLVFQTGDGPVHALSDIDLDISRGDFVSFIGPSGCGKTTLLRVIADLEQATSGSITVNGVSPEQARLQRAYGYVFQAASLYPWRTIAQNVALPLEIMGLSKSERAARIGRNLELVDLAGFEKKYPWQLSGGMQQRASIARALAVEPDLLLMDEPFGALDEIVRDHLNEQLRELWDKTGKTMWSCRRGLAEFETSSIVICPESGPWEFEKLQSSSIWQTGFDKACEPAMTMTSEA